MLSDLPSPLLRSFLAVVECGSLAGAAQRIGRSESALSLQMGRLEDLIGAPLFDRTGRALRLNQTGARLLPHARAILARIDAARSDLARPAEAPVRIGMVQDFVDSVLRPTLAETRDTAGGRAVTILIGNTAELLQAMGEERIDTALCAGDPPGGQDRLRLPMRWFGDPALLLQDTLPLIGITPPCPFLKAAQTALDAQGRPWRMALSTPSLDGLRAAVQAGLGLTCRTEAGLGLPPLSGTALPDLPQISYSVLERRRGKTGRSATAATLARHLARLADQSPR